MKQEEKKSKKVHAKKKKKEGDINDTLKIEKHFYREMHTINTTSLQITISFSFKSQKKKKKNDLKIDTKRLHVFFLMQ